MGDKEVEMLRQFTQEMGVAGPKNGFGIAELVQQFQQMSQYLSQLEQGIIGLSQEGHSQHLTTQMLIKLLIEKGICTDAEVQKKWKTDVAEPLRKAAADLQQKMKEMSEMHEKAAREEQLKVDIVDGVEGVTAVAFSDTEAPTVELEVDGALGMSEEALEVMEKIMPELKLVSTDGKEIKNEK